MKPVIGAIVTHKEYGSGTVFKITESNVFVSFDKLKRRFHYPEVFEKGCLVLNEIKENVVPVPDYPDIVPIHPELSAEDLEKLIEKEIEEAKKYTECPDI